MNKRIEIKLRKLIKEEVKYVLSEKFKQYDSKTGVIFKKALVNKLFKQKDNLDDELFQTVKSDIGFLNKIGQAFVRAGVGEYSQNYHNITIGQLPDKNILVKYSASGGEANKMAKTAKSYIPSKLKSIKVKSVDYDGYSIEVVYELPEEIKSIF